MKVRYRRFASVLVALGLLLIAATAVAWAGDPTPTPEPTPTPTPTATVAVTETPTAEAVTATPSPAVVELSETPPPGTIAPRQDATATPTATVTATPTATITPTATATTTPEPTATASVTPAPTSITSNPSGALLTICYFNEDTGTYSPLTLAANKASDLISDTRNVVPAPTTGCGGIKDAAKLNNLKNPVLLCHATGNAAHPYVLLSIPYGRGLGGHESDRGDLIPAPNGTCPGLAADATPTASATDSPKGTPTPADPTPTATGTVDSSTQSGGSVPQNTVLDSATGTTVIPAAAPVAARTELPFTGSYTWVIFGLGFGFVLMGTGMRIIARTA